MSTHRDTGNTGSAGSRGHPGTRVPPLGPRAWMKDAGEAPGMWDKKENVSRLLWVLYAISAALALLDVFIHRHSEHPWEHLAGFYPLYGFVGIVVLVLAAKGLRRLVMRPEDYYDAGGGGEG